MKWKNLDTLYNKAKNGNRRDNKIIELLGEVEKFWEKFYDMVPHHVRKNKQALNEEDKKDRFCSTYVAIDNLSAKAIRLNVVENSIDMEKQKEEQAKKRLEKDRIDRLIEAVWCSSGSEGYYYYYTLKQYVVCNNFIKELTSHIYSIGNMDEKSVNTKGSDCIRGAKGLFSNEKDKEKFLFPIHGSIDDKEFYDKGLRKYWDKK